VSFDLPGFRGPWPWWVAGPAIGAFVVIYAAATGRGVAVSSGFGMACARCFPSLSYFRKPSFSESWRFLFMIGIPLGGLAGALLSGHPGVVTAMGCFDRMVTSRLDVKVAFLFAGGLLAGFGARWAGG
jgi:hypothetical protein